MTKKQFIQEVAGTCDENLNTIEKIINQTLTTIKEKLAAGEIVEIHHFGKFFVKDFAERKGRNPRTGEEIDLPAHKSPVFRANRTLKDAVN